MCQHQELLDVYSVRAGVFTVAGAGGALPGVGAGKGGVFPHGIFFSTLSLEVMVVSHDRVYRNFIRTFRFTLIAAVATIQWTKAI